MKVAANTAVLSYFRGAQNFLLNLHDDSDSESDEDETLVNARARLAACDISLALEWFYEGMHPGTGLLWFDMPKSPDSIPPAAMRNTMNQPSKCIQLL